jgi:hypothetical protein
MGFSHFLPCWFSRNSLLAQAQLFYDTVTRQLPYALRPAALAAAVLAAGLHQE